MFVTQIKNMADTDAADFACEEEQQFLRSAEACKYPVKVIGSAGPVGYFNVVVRVADGYEVAVDALSGYHLVGYNTVTNTFGYR